eukprot:756338-Hanusia_phi.AAC.3
MTGIDAGSGSGSMGGSMGGEIQGQGQEARGRGHSAEQKILRGRQNEVNEIWAGVGGVVGTMCWGKVGGGGAERGWETSRYVQSWYLHRGGRGCDFVLRTGTFDRE